MPDVTSNPIEWRLPLIGRYLTASAAPTDFACRRLLIPDTPEFHAAIGELLSRLCFEGVWEQRLGGLEPIEMVMLATAMVDQWHEDECVEPVKAEWVRLYDYELTFDALSVSWTNYHGFDYSAFKIVVSRGFGDQATSSELRIRVNSVSSNDYREQYTVFDTGVTNVTGYHTDFRIPGVLTGTSGDLPNHPGYAEFIITNEDDDSFRRADFHGVSKFQRVQGGGHFRDLNPEQYIIFLELFASAGNIAAGTKIEVYGRELSDGINSTDT